MLKKQDSRYSFIRSKNPFSGIWEYDYKSPEIEVKEVNNLCTLHSTLPGFEYVLSRILLKQQIGKFFEALGRGIWGGKKGKDYTFSAEDITIKPDLESESAVREIKAISTGGHLLLKNKQIEGYQLLQTQNKNLELKIRFEIFRHGIYNVEKNYKSKPLEKLVADLTQNIRYLISIPFNVIYGISLNSNYSSSQGFGKHVSINSRCLNSLLAYPKETLEELGLNSGEIIIEKRKFPRGVRINNLEVAPFPILILNPISPEN